MLHCVFHLDQEFVTEQACNDITSVLKACNWCEISLLNEATGNCETWITLRSGWQFARSKAVNSENKESHQCPFPKQEGIVIFCVHVTLSEREIRCLFEGQKQTLSWTLSAVFPTTHLRLSWNDERLCNANKLLTGHRVSQRTSVWCVKKPRNILSLICDFTHSFCVLFNFGSQNVSL